MGGADIGPSQDALHALKDAVAAVNPGFVLEFKVMTEQIAESLQRDRLMAVLAGAFGVLAGVLAAIGLYGVIAYMVARRQNEIGVRMALGADRASVIRLVLREAMMLLAAGLAIGIGLALWAGQAATKLLFGLKPNDAATLWRRRCCWPWRRRPRDIFRLGGHRRWTRWTLCGWSEDGGGRQVRPEASPGFARIVRAWLGREIADGRGLTTRPTSEICQSGGKECTNSRRRHATVVFG